MELINAKLLRNVAVMLLFFVLSVANSHTAYAELSLTNDNYQMQNRLAENPDGTPAPVDNFGLNEDDMLDWGARGSLVANESFQYQPHGDPNPDNDIFEDVLRYSLQERWAHGFFTFSGKRRQDHPGIELKIVATRCGGEVGCSAPPSITFTDDGVQRTKLSDCGFVKPCWRGAYCLHYYASDPLWGGASNSWTLTIHNVGVILAGEVYVLGEDDGLSGLGGIEAC